MHLQLHLREHTNRTVTYQSELNADSCGFQLAALVRTFETQG